MSDLPKAPVRADVVLRAEAKLELQAKVPESSMGRFVDALTDLFRPISEAQGLKADFIRLQREDVAIKIAHRARERAGVEGHILTPPPLKVLIPLFEKASQEDISDNFIIDLWANLLVSACSEKAVSPRFISLIGELNSRQAGLLLNVIEKGDPSKFDETALYVLEEKSFTETVEDLSNTEELEAKTILDTLKIELDRNGIALGDITIVDDGEIRSTYEMDAPFGTSEEDFDLQVLSSLGLLNEVEIRVRPKVGRLNYVFVSYFIVTRLGSEFYYAVTGKPSGI